MDESMKNIFVRNFYPEHDAIHAEDKDDKWGVTVSRDENGKVSVTIVDKVEHNRVDLILGQDGFTQRR